MALSIAVLLLLQLLGGQSALFHSHGDHAEHVHLLATGSDDSSLDLSEAWHHEQHEDEGLPRASEEPPAHELVDRANGVLVEVPGSTVIARGSETCGVARLPGPAIENRGPEFLSKVEPRPPPEKKFADRPQVRRHRSGLATLLRSSRSILI